MAIVLFGLRNFLFIWISAFNSIEYGCCCDKKNNSCEDTSLDAEISSGQEAVRGFLTDSENGFAFTRTADTDAIDISLHEIPHRMYCTGSPEVVKEDNIERSKETEKDEIYHSKRCQTGIKSVSKTESGRVNDNSDSSIFTSERGHEIASENKFLAHALNEETEQIKGDYTEINTAAKTYAVSSSNRG